jgi:hypothetical protein
MLPNSVHDMLKLRKDWREFPAGSIAVQLADQVRDLELRTEVWRHLLRTALDRMVELWGKAKRPIPSLEERPRLTWRINEAVFLYLPEPDYDSLDRCINLAHITPFLTILTPPKRDTLMYQVLAPVLGDRIPIVSAVDTYISLRNVFAQADLHCGRDQVVLDLLSGYNKRGADAKLDESLLVEMPP